ncbi:hypothetical protein ERJ75_001477400 [Trypanosoma vivax]|nr:hypothetical protein ERJ75_001483800 [Trypanosoma vivax]KAH8606762.1 hypothetical protein ERJ75_001481300 [Trypanosoma vivax]KAH8606794.1 hypothetical protein ERJ75_001478000 [Trypanosoma vivax]KAH8606796.1 hypothetical protein ERJ75_001476400 [Trypanosoma vivax]KAH8606807.1 hypothetical protein ERJ75_001477400 [Trypanosoma vivax]
MLATAPLVVLLSTSLRCVSVSVVCCNQKATENFSDEEKCAAKGILLGWLNVTDKCRVRALEVLKNVTELRKRGEEVEAKASKAIAEYNELLGGLETTTAAHITSNIETAVREAKNTIAVASNSYVDATAAEKSASSSLEDGVVSSFYYIMVASKVISGCWEKATVN